VAASPYRFAVVVSKGDVLLGRLRRAALEGDPGHSAEQVMDAGPSTVRPDTVPGELAKHLRSRDLRTALVITPEGVVAGILRLDDLEQVV
jgi:Mg/Co/Ni transporter MgtE